MLGCAREAIASASIRNLANSEKDGSPSAEDHLHGDEAIVPEILSLVNDAHPATSQFAENLVAWDSGDGHFHRSAPAKTGFRDLR